MRTTVFAWLLLGWMAVVVGIGAALVSGGELLWWLAGVWGDSFSDTKLLFIGLVLAGLLVFFGSVVAALVRQARRVP